VQATSWTHVTDLERTYLEAFFHHSPDAIVIVDEEGRIVRANRRVASVLGYEPDELEGESVERLVPEADRQRHPSLREAYMEDPTARSMSAALALRARRSDGTTIPVDISLSPIEIGTERHVIAAVRDRTEQEMLRRKYRTLFEVAPDATFVADGETGRLLEVNQRAAELMGTTTEELVGRNHTDLYPADERERYRALFRRAVESEGSFRSAGEDDLHVITDDGERIPVEITARAFERGHQRVVVGAFRDVSAQREYERKLHRQIDRLEQFAHVLSHDLRNPLAVATGYVEQAQETGDLEHLTQVENEHDRIREMIDDVLAMVRHGYEVETVEPLGFESIVSECWSHVATADATIDVESVGLLYADPDRVRNLFENLFRNAVEHGGCDVTVRTGLEADGFYIEDDGPGIPSTKRVDVFEPGWTTTSEGTGLGLNIVREIASAHGWGVEVETGRDGGARFAFSDVRTAVGTDAYGPDDS